jgi:hypothetical protein
MVTTCFVYVHAKTNTSLHLASSNPNSLDGNYSLKSTKGKLEVVINF